MLARLDRMIDSFELNGQIFQATRRFWWGCAEFYSHARSCSVGRAFVVIDMGECCRHRSCEEVVELITLLAEFVILFRLEFVESNVVVAFLLLQSCASGYGKVGVHVFSVRFLRLRRDHVGCWLNRHRLCRRCAQALSKLSSALTSGKERLSILFANWRMSRGAVHRKPRLGRARRCSRSLCRESNSSRPTTSPG